MNEITNADLYGVLLDIKEDIGGLKSSTSTQLETIRNHSERISTLEDGAAKARGAAKVWALVGSGVGALVGGLGAAAATWLPGKH